MQKSYTLQQIAEMLNGTLIGDGTKIIHGISTLADAHEDEITFLDNEKYHSQLKQTKAAAVILNESYLEDCPTSAIVVQHPYLGYAKIAQLFWNKPSPYEGIHPTALIDETAELGKNVSIGPFAVIGAQTKIHNGAIIGAHCDISSHCVIGEDTELAARVTLYHQVKIGTHCMIHSGAVLGSDGFGFAPTQGKFEKIPQLGGVTIGDYVEIGANTTIDRGALTDTVIENGAKLDNQIQIGHNVKIGTNTVIAGCTGIAGSTEIGSNCMIGGGVGIAGHLKITDRVMFTGMAMVTHSVDKSGVYASGTGLLPRTEWQKCAVRFRQLNELAKAIKKQ